MKLLVFADSRGQHKKGEHPLYSDMLRTDGHQVDCYLCPYKWTTTLDFVGLVQDAVIKCSDYDWVILHTGIVEHSPRQWDSAKNDLYDSPLVKNLDNLKMNTRDYSKKIINSKKLVFDRIFSASKMNKYLSEPFDVKYGGELTMNMYSIDMLKKHLLPVLKSIPNLIWISSNKIVEGWNGDYFRKRPDNIGIILKYSQIMALELERVVDLTLWSDKEVKEYTLDNMHLTESGNVYIYMELCKLLNRSK